MWSWEEMGLTANRYSVSFRADENALKLSVLNVVMVSNSSQCTKTIESYNLNGELCDVVTRKLTSQRSLFPDPWNL